MNTDPDPDPIRILIRVFMTKNGKKITAGSKTTIYLFLGLHKGSCRKSIQLSKENIQHFKT
jgi:hypothetical protein